jgi:hypothetical protein
MKMSAAQHAQRILTAWDRANDRGFRTELESALLTCKTELPTSQLEREQQQLLESVAEHLQSKCTGQSLEAGFALLRHLRARLIQVVA